MSLDIRMVCVSSNLIKCLKRCFGIYILLFVILFNENATHFHRKVLINTYLDKNKTDSNMKRSPFQYFNLLAGMSYFWAKRTSISLRISSGVTFDSYRFTALPFLSMRNLVKFHLISLPCVPGSSVFKYL